MKRCIDCTYRFTCGKANSKITCDKFKKIPIKVTKLDEKDGDYFKFSRLEIKDDK